MSVFRLFFLVLVLTGWTRSAEIAAGDTITATVMWIFDGDSLHARIGNQERDLRLWGIDAPEQGQPSAEGSREALKRLVNGRAVTADVITIDDFNRLVVRLRVGTVDVNLQQLRDGQVWWFRRFAAEATAYGKAEKQARSERRGLWQAATPEPPWDFRDRQVK